MGSVLFALLAAMLVCSASAALPLSLTKQYSFVAVFDAGSSGTRVHIYRPLKTGGVISTASSIPEFAPNPQSKKVKPGLSSFAGKEEQVAAYMAPLSSFIKESIEDKAVQTPGGAAPSPDSCLVIFGATAGLRSVPNAAPKLLEAAKNSISALVPCAVGSFRVISGEEEGGYGWISVHALSKLLPGQPNAANDGMTRFKAPFGLHSELLYSHSFLGYGLDSARRSYNSFYASKLTATSPLY